MIEIDNKSITHRPICGPISMGAGSGRDSRLNLQDPVDRSLIPGAAAIGIR